MTNTAAAAAPKADAPVIRNGVNVTDLFNTIEAIKQNAEIAKFNFRLKNSWIDGDRNQSTIKEFSGALATQREDKPGFVFENGEHEVLLGRDQAPNPVEWLLHALIGCMTTTTAYHAASRNIAIEAIDSEVDGDIDLRGFLGLSSDIRKGYSAIRVKMRVKTKAMPETIRALTKMSPVFDVVSRSVPVDVKIETY
mgnify:CR=1 FL=1